ncbi:hypothetical protein M8818_006418 [Zalaria obscura]|uniref:Uncharacterized protein n=1 Tax=Zalaria obscura TaxID=2024903 RepID=A0ACC3S6S5_9PEZI
MRALFLRVAVAALFLTVTIWFGNRLGYISRPDAVKLPEGVEDWLPGGLNWPKHHSEGKEDGGGDGGEGKGHIEHEEGVLAQPLGKMTSTLSTTTSSSTTTSNTKTSGVDKISPSSTSSAEDIAATTTATNPLNHLINPLISANHHPPAPLPTSTSSADSRIVVLGALTTEDVSWVSTLLPTWSHAIYIVNNTTSPLSPFHTAFNKGREANAYLSYVLDHYPHFPRTIAFIHAHQNGYPQAWHTDAADHDNARALNALDTDFVQKQGYVNLRCNLSPGCPDEIQPFRSPPEADRRSEHAMSSAWQALFNVSEAAVPRVIAAACCAQFAVSAERVLARPRSDYERFHKWMLESELDDDTLGRVFEYLWHVFFGMGAVFCPDQEGCYRDVYQNRNWQ